MYVVGSAGPVPNTLSFFLISMMAAFIIIGNLLETPNNTLRFIFTTDIVFVYFT